MRRYHRALFWTVGAVHLLAAAVTWYAGVAVQSSVALAVGGLAAAVLGFTRPAETVDDPHRLDRLPPAGTTVARATTRRRGSGIGKPVRRGAGRAADQAADRATGPFER